MEERITATEAKLRFGQVMRRAAEKDVIVVSRGRPTVAILSYEEYRELQNLRERLRREKALERLERLAVEVRQRNSDLSESEAEELSDRFTRDTIEEMISRGKVRYRGEE